MRSLSMVLMFVLAINACGSNTSSVMATAPTTPAKEVTEKLMISVQKATVALVDVNKTVKLLEYHDASMGTCYAEAKVTNYMDYTEFAPQAPYYGVAFVTLTYSCGANAQVYLKRVSGDKRFQLWSNPHIAPLPIMGGSN